MNSEVKHKWFCFAGEPAPCEGYFPGDVLPCVCTTRNVVAELSQQALAAPALNRASADAPAVSPEPGQKAVASTAF